MDLIKKYLFWLLLFASVALLVLGFLYSSLTALYTISFTSQQNTLLKVKNVTSYACLEASAKNPLPCLENKQDFMKINITHSFYTNPLKDIQSSFLCNLNVINYCYSQYVAEVIGTFWIVSPIYSPYQTRTTIRYELHQNFQYYVQSIGMSASTLEAIREDRNQKYLITQPGREPYEIQSQIYDDIYIRENLLNVAANKIKEWEYIGWIDAHHLFDNVYWWEEAIISMEKYASVQLFQTLSWLSWENQTEWNRPGAIYASIMKNNLTYGSIPFFGNAYSVRREVYDQMEYILDTGIGGCCDCAYVKASLDSRTTFDYMDRWPHYTKQFAPWIKRTAKIFKGLRKGVRGDAVHLPHEANFLYFSLMEYLDANDFNIERDLEKDQNGTLRLKNKSFKRVIEFYSWFANYRLEIILSLVGLGVLVGLFILNKISSSKSKKPLKSIL